MLVYVGNQSYEVSHDSTAEDLARKLHLTAPEEALAVEIGGQIKDLSVSLKEGDKLRFLNFSEAEGKEVFWHTSAHVLAQAVLRLYPEAIPTIGPPIENGFYYDFANLKISDEDLEKIEKEMQKVASENHASKRSSFETKDKAKAAFGENPYKCAIIDRIPDGEELTAYTQGEFFDLCRGPHLSQLGKIKAIKVMKTAGAYWLGDSKNEMLTRIYAITFPSRDLLKNYLRQLEEAKKRDHKIIGPKLDLFSLKEEAPGMPFIHPKGMIVWKALTNYLSKLLYQADYEEIKTPCMMSRELWERSGHWEHYRENMFTSSIEERDFAIKPMNCPGCMLFYKGRIHSYRELPMRIAEIGNVHRFEPSGSLSGLFRVRSFHQDDAHLFMQPSDIEDEILGILNLADEIYSTFGLEYHLELSTRPESHTIGTDEDWKIATEGLQKALERKGQPYVIKHGDGAFYGPKIDFHIRDALGRTWQCGTVQLDMALPERFELEYSAPDGTKKRPVMLHRAIFGSIERFFGILIEHFEAKFPLWLSPSQIRILPVADRHIPFSEEVKARFKKEGFWVTVDSSQESLSKKIREAQLSKTNYILTIGDREVENGKIALRTRDNIVRGEMEIEPFIQTLLKERDERYLQSPFSG